MSLTCTRVDTYTNSTHGKKKSVEKSPDITWSFPVLHKNHPSRTFTIHNAIDVFNIYSEESKLSDECFIKAIGRVNNVEDDYYSVPNFIIDIVYDHHYLI